MGKIVPLYQWSETAGYWVRVKQGKWPACTGWAEHREAQRIFRPKLDEFMAKGLPKEVAWELAAKYATAEMYERTNRRRKAAGGSPD
ncbi:hypothetical protein [Smaragdicoccus niigatensis]|uniref:hypothetical protein n=1 Tax=Smaragdicoccus niigatensis TaxID=359359 RepID=UPI000378FB42|nr:hypothetical protein [Smaragdicoccus niigatensis]